MFRCLGRTVSHDPRRRSDGKHQFAVPTAQDDRPPGRFFVMTPVVHIAPRHDAVPTAVGPIDVASIHLPGTPRGAVLVLTADTNFEHEAATLLNAFAAAGFEGHAADVTEVRGTPDKLVPVLRTLIDLVGEHGWTREQMGIVGYANGGGLALLASAWFELGAAVSFSLRPWSTGCSDLARHIAELAPRIRTSWLYLTGDHDPLLPRSEGRRLEGALLRETSVYTQIVTYPGVGADFYRTSPEVPAIAAAFDAWQRTVEWLELHVVPRLTPAAEAWRRRQAIA